MTTEYTLPQQMAFALNTDRGELCLAFAESIRAENELAACFANLIGGLLNDRRDLQNQLIALQDAIEQNRDQFDAFNRKVEAALKAARGEIVDEESVET